VRRLENKKLADKQKIKKTIGGQKKTPGGVKIKKNDCRPEK
jgi:hypothetical protein